MVAGNDGQSTKPSFDRRTTAFREGGKGGGKNASTNFKKTATYSLSTEKKNTPPLRGGGLGGKERGRQLPPHPKSLDRLSVESHEHPKPRGRNERFYGREEKRRRPSREALLSVLQGKGVGERKKGKKKKKKMFLLAQ